MGERIRALLSESRWQLLSLLGVALALYFPLFSNYFSMDEWGVLAYARITPWHDILQPTNGWYPIGNINAKIMGYLIQPTHVGVWMALIVLYQLIAIYLVYLIGWRLSESRTVGWLAALIFTISPIGSEMLRYPAMMGAIMGIDAMLASIASLLGKSYRWSVAFLIIAFITNNYIPALLPVLLVTFLPVWWRDRKDWKSLMYVLIAHLCVIGLFMYIQQYISAGPETAVTSYVDKGHLIDSFQKLFIKAPLVVLPQLFVVYKGYFTLSAMQRLAERILIGIAAWLIILLVYKTKRRSARFQTALFAFWWMYSSYLYFSVIRQPLIDAAVSSRYLYIPLIGTALLLAQAIEWVGSLELSIWQRWIRLAPVTAVVVVLLAIPYFKQTREQILADVHKGRVRLTMIQQLLHFYPVLPSQSLLLFPNQIFERDHDYSITANLGYVLSLVYYKDTMLHRSVAADSDLFNTADIAWYMSDSLGGFGYAQTVDQAKKLMAANHLSAETVISLQYDSATGKLNDTTTQTRSQLVSQ